MNEPVMYDWKDLMTFDEVEELTGLARSTIYQLMASSGLPRPIKIGPRLARWSRRELNAWLTEVAERRSV